MAVHHLRQNPRQAQQLDVRLGRGRLVFSGEVDVLDLPADVAGREVEHVDDAAEASRADVLGEILAVGVDDGIVDLRDIAEAEGTRERLNRLRHAAGEEVRPQQLHDALVDRCVQPSFHLEGSNDPGKALSANRVEELRETHRLHVQVRNPAYRHGGPMVGEGEVQHRARGQHRQVGHVLSKVTQGGDGLWDGLDFVKEQQSIGSDGADTGQRFQDVQQMGRVVPREGGPEVSVAFQVDLG